MTNMALSGNRGKFWIIWRRCLVSVMYAGCVCAIRLKIAVRYFESLSVGESHSLMIGRGGLFGL